MLERQNAEPPLVLRARDYIDKHKTEELSLTDVAKAAGASVFHFCKVFHKNTGLKFTDYVARVRVEDARTRLLNPNLRISEIDYDVGYNRSSNSIAHSNASSANHPAISARAYHHASAQAKPPE